MAAPRSPGGSVNTIIPQSCRQCKCAGLIVLSGTPGPAQNIEVDEHRAIAVLVRR